MENINDRSKRTPPTTINDFPLEILKRFVWLLPLVDSARTSILSNQWRDLWLSNPNWELTPETIRCEPGEWHRFERVVNDIIFRHNGSGIEKIKIEHTNTSGALTPSTTTWLDHLATYHPLTELELDIGNSSAPPPSLYHCKTLVYLRLSCMQMNLPDNVNFPRVKRMSLFSVNFINSGEFQKLMNGCKALEIIELTNVNCTRRSELNMQIDSPLLKVVKFSCEHDLTNLHLSAKNIETLELKGKHFMFPKLFVFSKLNDVTGLQPEERVQRYLDQKRENRIRHYGEKINSALHALIKTTTLLLGEWCIEYLTTIADTLELPIFPNLKSLEIYLWPNKHHAHIILYLLKCMPNLEYLKLVTCKNTCNEIYQDEQRNGYPLPTNTNEEIYLNLTHIDMRLFRDTSEEFVLVQTLSRCCPNMNIFDIKFSQSNDV